MENWPIYLKNLTLDRRKSGLLPNGGRGMSARVVKNQTAIFGSKKCQKGLKWL